MIGVVDELAQWREAVTKYEFVGGEISSFPYLDYYDALSRVRGAMSGKGRAIAFDIDQFGKRRVMDSLPRAVNAGVWAKCPPLDSVSTLPTLHRRFSFS